MPPLPNDCVPLASDPDLQCSGAPRGETPVTYPSRAVVLIAAIASATIAGCNVQDAVLSPGSSPAASARVPAAPRDLQTTSESASSIGLRWNAPEGGPVGGYRLWRG